MKSLLRPVALLPLPLLHLLGGVLGWIVYFLSARFRKHLRQNLELAGYRDAHMRRAAIVESGKGLLELSAMWLRPQAVVAGWVKELRDEHVLLDAERAGGGVLIVTPHLGCFEIIAQWMARRGPFTALYRPPRMAALEPLMLAGRERDRLTTATTDIRGVRVMLKALKSRQAAGLLPDQVPGTGEGEWADFFGRPAYTMTLATRLAEASGATIVLVCAERLPRGRGYRLHFASMPERDAGESSARWVNRAVEMLVRRCPEQYLWAYNRYKVPAGVQPPKTD